MASKENKSHQHPKLRSGEEKDNEGDSDQNAAGMSLDVLAHVASETLKNEPKSAKKSPRKKISLRMLGNADVLTLDQILGLTEKTVVNLFTEVESNEISRTFTYTCQLMPKQCQKSTSSFGSEMRARAEMRKHIYEHLAVLEKDEGKSKTKFTAESVPARKKRLLSNYGPRATAKKRPKTCTSSSDTPNPKVIRKDTAIVPIVALRDCNEDKKLNSIGFVPVADKLRYNYVSKDILKKDLNKDEGNETDSDEENEKRIEENEQFIIDLLSKTQPHHDHSYTTIFGRRKGADLFLENDTEEDKDDNKTSSGSGTVVWVDMNTPKKAPTPILFLRHRSPDENVPMVSAEEIITGENEKEDQGDKEAETHIDPGNLSRGQKPYPPMPKCGLAKRGRLGFDICDIPTDGSDEEFEFLKKKKKSHNPLGREGREGNLGWEPKLALRLIRELKGRKKDDNMALKCKICKDKTFTAAATLMYHYRSHAGIKPFVCLICNTTFTRQHSLNYHMLIHNNQSRFTCSDCGRKFRHPSHFKEHLRRHTGETPFECRDCGQRFKTRNTYKRHLKTRHGKLLTASGIHELSSEEFAKVKTKRYNIPKLPAISYEMPELTFTKLVEQKKDLTPAEESGTTPNSTNWRTIIKVKNESAKKNKRSAYPNLPDISYEMPELTFTKIVEQKKKTQQDSDKSDDHDDLELKTLTEIKKEIGSDSEDPELESILQVLSEAEAAEKKNQVVNDGNSDKKKNEPFSTGLYMNKTFAAAKTAVSAKE